MPVLRNSKARFGSQLAASNESRHSSLGLPESDIIIVSFSSFSSVICGFTSALII
jgi:hypothetical protein